MSAYDSLRLDDLRERQQVRGETLTPAEQATLNRLAKEKEAEEAAKPRPWLYGGDMTDAF